MVAKKEGLSQDERMLLVASFFYLASTMMVNPLIAGFTGTFGASASFVGLVGGLMGFCSLFIRPVAGNLADLFTKRHLATAGAIVMSVSTLLYGVAQSAWQVAALRLMSGAGYSFCSVCMASWFASLLPRDRVGSGMGMFGMMNALGMAVGPAVGFQVYQAFGYRAALAFAGALAALTAILVQFVQNPGRAVPGVRVQDKAKSLVAPDAVPAAVIVGLFTVPYMVTQSFLASYVEDLQINVRVGLFFPVYALVLLALRYGLKRAFDSWRFSTFLIGSSICATAAFCLLSIMSGGIAMFSGGRLRGDVLSVPGRRRACGGTGRHGNGEQHVLHGDRHWHGAGSHVGRLAVWGVWPVHAVLAVPGVCPVRAAGLCGIAGPAFFIAEWPCAA